MTCIIATTLSLDEQVTPDVLVTGPIAVLLAGIPFNGPMAVRLVW